MIDMTIGERLKVLREAANMTQPQMAAIAGTSKQYVSQLESGRNKVPNWQYLEAWSRHFGVSMQWLATGKDDEQPSAPARVTPMSGADDILQGLQEALIAADEATRKAAADLLSTYATTPDNQSIAQALRALLRRPE